MAQIRELYWGHPVVNVHPTEVDAELRSVRLSNGEVRLQISTFGSDHRVSKPKVSQTIQMDKATALKLREAIDELFGG